MTATERNLLAMLRAYSCKTGDFTLASGAKSQYYIDVKRTVFYPRGARRIGAVLYDYARRLAPSAVAVGGMAIGAIPLVSAVMTASHYGGIQGLNGFFVREEAKDHGTQQTIEGCLKPGERVVIVEDVVSSGESALKAVMAARTYDCTVDAVIALIDRDMGGQQLFRHHGITYTAAFTLADLLEPHEEAV